MVRTSRSEAHELGARPDKQNHSPFFLHGAPELRLPGQRAFKRSVPRRARVGQRADLGAHAACLESRQPVPRQTLRALAQDEPKDCSSPSPTNTSNRTSSWASTITELGSPCDKAARRRRRVTTVCAGKQAPGRQCETVAWDGQQSAAAARDPRLRQCWICGGEASATLCPAASLHGCGLTAPSM
jgi:hypothetical protein